MTKSEENIFTLGLGILTLLTLGTLAILFLGAMQDDTSMILTGGFFAVIYSGIVNRMFIVYEIKGAKK